MIGGGDGPPAEVCDLEWVQTNIRRKITGILVYKLISSLSLTMSRNLIFQKPFVIIVAHFFG